MKPMSQYEPRQKKKKIEYERPWCCWNDGKAKSHGTKKIKIKMK